jgi:hypothetical protein
VQQTRVASSPRCRRATTLESPTSKRGGAPSKPQRVCLSGAQHPRLPLFSARHTIQLGVLEACPPACVPAAKGLSVWRALFSSSPIVQCITLGTERWMALKPPADG